MIRRFLRNYLAYMRDDTYSPGPANAYDWFTALAVIAFLLFLMYLGGLIESRLNIP